MTEPSAQRRLIGVLLTFRRPDALSEALDALSRQSRRLDALVVVDNAGDPRTEELVANASTTGGPVLHIPMVKNLGPAGGFAAGLTAALTLAGESDWLVCLEDDDPVPDEHVLADIDRSITEVLSHDATVAGVGMGGATFDIRRSRLQQVRCADSPAPVDYLKGGWFPAYRASVVDAVGTHDPSLFFGFEELDYGLRLRNSGYRLYVYDAGRRGRDGHLKPSRPAISLGAWNWRRYYSIRNLLVVLLRHGHRLSALRTGVTLGLIKPLANLPRHPRQASRHLVGGTRAVFDAFTGRLGLTVSPDGSARQVQLGPRTSVTNE